MAFPLTSHPSCSPPPSLRTFVKHQAGTPPLRHNNQTLTLPHLKQLHARLFRLSLHHDTVLITKLISSSATSAPTAAYAARVFATLPAPDTVLCNTILKLYAQCCLHEQALLFFVYRLLALGFYPNEYTFPFVFKACAGVANVEFGMQVHGRLVKCGGVCREIVVSNSLMDMYFKCGRDEDGSRIFEGMDERDSTSWNIVLLGLVNSGESGLARKMFDEMRLRDVVSWNTLISGYAKKGEMGVARELFDEMPKRNLVSWNALISGYSQNGRHDEALLAFDQLLASGLIPDCTTMLSVLSACSSARSLDFQLVDKIIGFAQSMMTQTSVLTALLNLYAKIGRIEDAKKIFDGIIDKDLVTWNAMISGYSQNQRPMEAIKLFRSMQASGMKPDGMTMISLIDSCSQLGFLYLGEWVHALIENNRVKLDVFLLTALIDMYAKCGDLHHSRLLFSKMPKKDLASWNAMINGLAIHGRANEALELFSLMEASGVAPNDVSFIGLLNACSHGGLVDKGLEVFYVMQKQHGIMPRIEHYGCVIDLLGRAGQVEEAYGFIKAMPIEPDVVVWGTLLGACRCHNNVELAEEAARQLAERDPGHDGNYVLLSNVYASMGKWGDVENVRAQMRACQVRKVPGWSAVEVEGVVHEFKAGDRCHPQSEEIYAAWDELVERLRLMGYVPDTGALLKNFEAEEEKEEALFRHSEKLALSYALINSKTQSPIRIVKNLRICSDCHRAMELVSEIEEREIIVRDRNRFHQFRHGHCSCRGYW